MLNFGNQFNIIIFWRFTIFYLCKWCPNCQSYSAIILTFEGAMHKYPKMLTLLARHFSYEESPELMEVGRHCLQALCFEIAYERNLKILNGNLTKLMPQILTAEFKLNSEEQLLHYFGGRIFIRAHECQDEKAIAKEALFRVLSCYNLAEIPAFPQPNSLRQGRIEAEEEEWECYESCSVGQPPLCESKEIFKQEGSFMQAYLPQMLAGGSIEKEKEQILCYIASLATPKTELSQFCQAVRNSFPTYNREREGDLYLVTAVIELDNYFTSHVPKRFESRAKFANLKRAQNQSALGLLEQIWVQYPESWRRFSERPRR